MKIEKQQLSETEIKLTIALEKELLVAAEKRALKDLAPTVTAKGFRKGKMPENIAKKQLDPAVLSNRIIELAINRALVEAFDQENIHPLDQPRVDIRKFVPNQELEFTALVEVVPTIKLPNYKKLKVKKALTEVTDKDVDRLLERIRKGFAEDQEVKRAAKLGDKVVIDFTGYVDDKPFNGGAAKDFTLELGSGQFIPGFEDGVVGKKAGDRFDLKLNFPKDYHAKNLAGRPTVFTTTLKKVLEVKLPKLDDQLARKAGKFKTLGELKADIRKNLIVQKEEEAANNFRDDLVKELATHVKTAIPGVLKKDQIEALKRDLTQNLTYQGMTLEQYLETINKTEEEWIKTELEPAAEARVKAGLAIAEISKLEKIDVTQEEVDAKLAELRTQYANSKDALKQLENPQVWYDLRNNLLTNKTIDRVVELNS